MIRTPGLVMAMAFVGLMAGCGGSNNGRVRPGVDASGGTGGSGGAGGTGGQATGGTGGQATGGTGGQATGGTGGSSETDGGGTGTDVVAPDTAPPEPVPVTCEGIATPACNDGLDNDSDGFFDMADGECVAPCDNDEGSFATGIPGDNMDACKQDCFFDGNSGQGDDGCNWDLRCDSANPGANSGCAYEANRNCQDGQSEKCVRNCRKLTPNGCDCFGCCAVTYPGGSASVLLVSGCTADKFGDAMVCPRCTQNTACINTCEPCEVCLGKPAPDPSCGGGGTPGTDGGSGGGETDGGSGSIDAAPVDAGDPAPWCPAGVVSCGPSGQVPANGCGDGYYCLTGCCMRYVID
jgi:hypothetical protein